MPRVYVRVPPEERFWSKVLIGDGCWEWQGGKFNSGYGLFTVPNGQPIGAHRFAWELINGPILDGLFVCHRCDNRPCVRPGHMFLGAQSDNMRDMAEKGRNGKQRLSAAQIVEMRAMRSAGMSTADIAARFMTCQSYAFRICRGDRRQHVPRISS